jgi:hypothetical protein
MAINGNFHNISLLSDATTQQQASYHQPLVQPSQRHSKLYETEDNTTFVEDRHGILPEFLPSRAQMTEMALKEFDSERVVCALHVICMMHNCSVRQAIKHLSSMTEVTPSDIRLRLEKSEFTSREWMIAISHVRRGLLPQSLPLFHQALLIMNPMFTSLFTHAGQCYIWMHYYAKLLGIPDDSYTHSSPNATTTTNWDPAIKPANAFAQIAATAWPMLPTAAGVPVISPQQQQQQQSPPKHASAFYIRNYSSMSDLSPESGTTAATLPTVIGALHAGGIVTSSPHKTTLAPPGTTVLFPPQQQQQYTASSSPVQHEVVSSHSMLPFN